MNLIDTHAGRYFGPDKAVSAAFLDVQRNWGRTKAAVDLLTTTAAAAAKTVSVTAADTTPAVLDSTINVSRQVTKATQNAGANETMLLSHSTPLATDGAKDILSCKFSWDSGTRVLTLTPVTLDFDTEGHSRAGTLAGATTITVGTLALKNDGSTVAATATSINLDVDYGMSVIFAFASNGDLDFKNTGTQYQVLMWGATKPEWSYVKWHA